MKKICVTCNRELDIKYFSFRTDTNKYRGQCKMCHKGYSYDRFDKIQRIEDLFKQGLKECSHCKEVKELSFFGIDRSTKTGYCSRCKSCLCKLGKKSRDSPNGIRSRLKRVYKAKDKDVNSYLKINNCQICGIHITKKNKSFDHDHDTGEYRGTLCRDCNIGLGLFYDSISNLENAIKYLKSYYDQRDTAT